MLGVPLGIYASFGGRYPPIESELPSASRRSLSGVRGPRTAFRAIPAYRELRVGNVNPPMPNDPRSVQAMRNAGPIPKRCVGPALHGFALLIDRILAADGSKVKLFP